MIERLQKILSQRGVCSRRHAEQLILDGRVAVNGSVVSELGFKADPDQDKITIDDRELPSLTARKTLMLNKPRGYLSTCQPDRERGRSILELIPSDRRYFPVGRLDRDTAGLLLLTDDGDLAFRLTHPKHGTHKIYIVETATPLSDLQVDRLLSGVFIESNNIPARALEVERLSGNRLRVVLGEGRKRQIRYMIAEVGSDVRNLTRIQIGGLELGNLPIGKWRELSPRELALLEDSD